MGQSGVATPPGRVGMNSSGWSCGDCCGSQQTRAPDSSRQSGYSENPHYDFARGEQ